MKHASTMGMGFAVLVFAMAAGSAEAFIDPDSEFWENSWEGDVVPASATPAWSDTVGGTDGIDSWTVMTEGSDTFARFEAPVYGAGIQVEQIGVELDPRTNGGAAVEWRFRNTSGVMWLDIAMTGVQGGVSSFPRTTTSTSSINVDLLGGSSDSGSINTSPAWTTLRMVGTDTGIQVFKDGDLVTPHIDISGLGGSDARFDTFLRFFAGSNTNEYDLDYLRWTDGVIPEPGTLGVLAAGALLALARRRRR